MDPEPRPVQRPVPILIGGHSDVALDRAGRIGDGWIAAMMSPPRLAEHWAKVRDAAARAGRDPDGLLLVASTPAMQGAELVDAVGERAELGVDHLTIGLRGLGPDAMLDEIRSLGTAVLTR
jgi:alkanesulfonate monooxygenase SsuD/methylene tetrahydromethanopterin reductase-like flavin-dependent oxidoreductase (luciferase family)